MYCTEQFDQTRPWCYSGTDKRPNDSLRSIMGHQFPSLMVNNDRISKGVGHLGCFATATYAHWHCFSNEHHCARRGMGSSATSFNPRGNRATAGVCEMSTLAVDLVTLPPPSKCNFAENLNTSYTRELEHVLASKHRK